MRRLIIKETQPLVQNKFVIEEFAPEELAEERTGTQKKRGKARVLSLSTDKEDQMDQQMV